MPTERKPSLADAPTQAEEEPETEILDRAVLKERADAFRDAYKKAEAERQSNKQDK